jgi:hypothetical protein
MPIGGAVALATLPSVSLIAVVVLGDTQELFEDVDQMHGGLV